MASGIVAFFGSHLIMQVIWSFLTVGTLKGGLLILAAGAMLLLMRGRAPESRHVVWFGALVGMLILPISWLALPPVQLALPEGAPGHPVFQQAAPLLSQNRILGLVDTASGSAALSRQARPGAVPLLAYVVMGVWILGGLFFFLRMVGGRVAAARLAVGAPGAGLPPHVLRDACARAGVRRGVAVFASARCGIPFTFGHLQPRIVLPAAAGSWTRTRLRAVLLHELAHIRRGDWLLSSVARGICAVLWFLPFAWLAFSRMQREEEKSCDRSVLQGGIGGTAYASDLLELVRSAPRRPVITAVECPLGRRATLKKRIMGILRLASRPVTAGLPVIGRLLVVGFCCLLPLLAMTCATSPGAGTGGSRLFGTWVNRQYESTYWTYKIVYQPDGKELAFEGAPGGAPTVEGRYTVDGTWKDTQGGTWFRVSEKYSFLPFNAEAASGNRWHTLIRMNGAGDMLEVETTQIGPLDSFGTFGGFRWTYYRM